MNKKSLKLFSLLALVLLLAAGAAYATINGTSVFLALAGTTNNTPTLDMDKVGQAAGETGYNTIAGYGSVVGSITNTNLAPAMDQLVLALQASSGQTLEIAPTNAVAPLANRTIDETNAGANTPLHRIQFLVNDGATNNGMVLIKASNADAPTAAFRTIYSGGTFVYGGTLAATNNNSLGQSWVAIQGRPTTAPRVGATFKVDGVTQLLLGANDPNGTATTQPFYLVRDLTAGAQYDGAQLATVDVGRLSSTVQELRLEHGLGEVRTILAATPFPGANAVEDTLLAFDAASDVAAGTGVVGTYEATWAPTAGGTTRATRLVKTGGGILTIDSNGPLLAGAAYPEGALTGARHTGGTDVLGGTLVVRGRNATTQADRYTGYLGAVWQGTWAGGLFTITAPAGDYMQATGPVAAGAIHNPLAIRNAGSRVLVDRSQFFSFFNSDAGTAFTAKEFTVAGTPMRPQVAVTLNGFHSNFNGVLGAYVDGTPSSFDLVVQSMGSTVGLPVGVTPTTDPSQAMLTLGNAENDITGTTLVTRGVLGVAGANSIATKGTGDLTVGTTATPIRGFNTTLTDKGVFLALANSTFTNRTFVNGLLNVKPVAGTNIIGTGALAAATGTEVAFSDVTINGSMEINPQAVSQVIAAGVNGDIIWTNTDLYPTWGGTVVFGGVNASYDIGGTTLIPTQIAVSRGTWGLNSYPVKAGFAQVMLRESATLSLAKDVNDFGKHFDLQVDDDARIRMVVRPSDIADSRAAAMDKPAMLSVRTMDVTWLGAGQDNKDKRLAIQLDLEGRALTKGQWLKVVYAEDAVKWNNIHYLRDNSNTQYEDYAKIRPGLINNTDLTTKVVAHVDENSYTILLEVLESVDPIDPPTPGNDSLAGSFTPDMTTALPGTQVSFALGDWNYTDVDGNVVTDVDVVLSEPVLTNVTKVSDNLATNGTYVAQINSTATVGTNASVAVTGTYTKADGTTISKTVTGSVTVSGTEPNTNGGSSGCDAGFAGLALLLAAPLFLRKKD